jgi:ABC-2 type transport system ATP-binding protein
VVINKGKVVCEGTPAEVKSLGGGNGSRNVKLIRCATTLAVGLLQAIPGVTQVDVADGVAQITSTTPEATLRELLALDQGLHSLEVASPALEDAFLALTSN